jgi:hypothetical protein
MIKLTASCFVTHKKAEGPDDCQDAGKRDDEQGRYAIADGATRSFFPKEWATLLVEHFCESPDLSLAETDWGGWIKPIQQEWYKQVEERVKERNLFFLTNSFIEKESALATFIGLKFNKESSEWRSMIVGDSCLFHIGDTGFKSYLIGKSSDFTNRPEVVASFPKDNHHRPTVIDGHAKPGDTFILATDALAKWMLEHEEVGRLDAAIDAIQSVETDEEFHQFVDEERDNKAIRLDNDDVTLMLISVEPVEQRPSVEETELQSKFVQIIFWAMVLAFFGFAAFCYMLLCFFDKG